MLRTLGHDLRARICEKEQIEEQLARICEKAAGDDGAQKTFKLELYPIDDEMAAADVLSADKFMSLAEAADALCWRPGTPDAHELIAEVVSLFVGGSFYLYISDDSGCAYRAEADGFEGSLHTLRLDLFDDSTWDGADFEC